jgi:hypothetical protein
MTTDDVIGEFLRSAPYIDGVAETHYLDANAMAAEIVRLRACVERVRAVQQYRPIGYADCDVVGKDDMAEFSDRTVLVRYRDILAAMEGA